MLCYNSEKAGFTKNGAREQRGSMQTSAVTPKSICF